MCCSLGRQKNYYNWQCFSKNFRSIKQQNKKNDKGNEFYNESMKSWLQENDIYFYSTHNEGKFLVAKDFLESLRTKFTNIWLQWQKNIFIDKLDDIINK